MLLTTSPTNIIYSLQDTWINVAIVLGSRLTTDIRRSRNDGLLETIAEFLGEWLISNTDAHAAIIGNQVLRQINGAIENQGCRLSVTLFQTINKLPCHIGHISEVALHTGIRVYQTDQGLGVVTLFNRIDTLYSLSIRGITTNTPNGIRRIEY